MSNRIRSLTPQSRLAAGIVALAIGMSACASTVPEPGIRLVHRNGTYLVDSSAALDSAKTFMLAAGCGTGGSTTPIGSVLVPVPLAGQRRFDCHSLTKDSLARVVVSYTIRHLPGSQAST